MLSAILSAPARRRQKPRHSSRKGHEPPQEEATRRRAQGATLKELAESYDRSITTMRRATRAV
jgi:hypothetical protein